MTEAFSDTTMDLIRTQFFAAFPRPKVRGARDAARQDEWELYRDKFTRLDLNPLDQEICPVWRFDKTAGDLKMSITVQIGGLRKIASRTGAYAGSDLPVMHHDANGGLERIDVTVYRIVQGVRCPFAAPAFLAEYDAHQGLWSSKPHVMLAKCAEAMALRKGFPELEGLYVAEEFDHDGQPAVREAPDVTPDAPKAPTRAERAAADVPPMNEIPGLFKGNILPDAVPEAFVPPKPPAVETFFDTPEYKGLCANYKAVYPKQSKKQFISYCSDILDADMTCAENWTLDAVTVVHDALQAGD